MAALPMRGVLAMRDKDVPAVGTAQLYQSRRMSYTNAWYLREPRRLAGVAAFKAFGVEGGADTYTFELAGFGRLGEGNGDLDAIGGLPVSPSFGQ